MTGSLTMVASPQDHDTQLVRTAALVCRVHEPGSAQADTAARQIYQRFGPLAWTIARRLVGDEELAREIVQDAMLTVWRTAHRFDPQRGSAVSWVAQIVRSRAIDTRRRASAARRSSEFTNLEAAEAQLTTASDEVEAGFLTSERSAQLAKALSQLPVEQRVLIELSFLQGYSQSELSTMLQLPLGTVKARILRGLQKLRPALAPLRAIDNAEGEQQ